MKEAFDDVLIFEELKKTTEFSVEIKNIEEKMSELILPENKLAFQFLITNFKRYLYKHILAIQQEVERKEFRKGLEFGKLLAKNEKRKKKKDN